MKLSAFESLFREQGPIATAYLDVSLDNAGEQVEMNLRWAALKLALRAAGAPDETIRLIEPVITAPTGLSGGWGRAVAATSEQVLLERVIPGRTAAYASWGALPHIAPLMEADAWGVPHIVVEVDATGAAITVTALCDRWSETVEGEDHHLHKVNVGGWAHLHFQHRAESRWDANAEAVARRLDRLASELSPEVIIVAGDERAGQFLRDNVNATTLPLLRFLHSEAESANTDNVLADALRRSRVVSSQRNVVTALGAEQAEEGAVADDITSAAVETGVRSSDEGSANFGD